jgi:hypothetical protein
MAAAAVAAAFFSMTPGSAAPGGGMAPNLTGGMADRRYLIGLWSCNVKLTSALGAAPSSELVTLSFSTAPNDTLEGQARALDFSAAAFSGYNPFSKSWWISAIDNTGSRVFETSKNGTVFVGSITMAGGNMPVRETWKKLSDKKFRTVTELQVKGAWKVSADHLCTKS